MNFLIMLGTSSVNAQTLITPPSAESLEVSSAASVVSSAIGSSSSLASVAASVGASVSSVVLPPQATSERPIASASESAIAFLNFFTKKPSFFVLCLS